MKDAAILENSFVPAQLYVDGELMGQALTTSILSLRKRGDLMQGNGPHIFKVEETEQVRMGQEPPVRGLWVWNETLESICPNLVGRERGIPGKNQPSPRGRMRTGFLLYFSKIKSHCKFMEEDTTFININANMWALDFFLMTFPSG